MHINNDQQAVEENEEQRLSDLLKSTRLAQGKTLEQISEATSISTQMLQALEEEDHENLPAKVFVRGFIRLYVAQLDLDPQMALIKFEEEWADESNHHFNSNPSLPTKGKPLPILPILSILVTLTLLTGVLYLVFNKYMSTESTATIQEEQPTPPLNMIPEPTLTNSPQQLTEDVEQNGNMEQKSDEQGEEQEGSQEIDTTKSTASQSPPSGDDQTKEKNGLPASETDVGGEGEQTNSPTQ